MRLIDADALSKDLEKRWNVNDDQDFCNKEVWHALEEAPTIEPNGDLISRQDAVKEIDSFCDEVWTESEADFARGLGTALSIVESLPSAEQVTGKLNNPDDSLLTADSEACKEQKSKLDLISRQDAIAEFRDGRDVYDIMESIEELPSAETPTVLEKHQLSEETPTNTSTDLISRQSAIDAFRNVLDSDFPYISEVTPRERIESIPSAPDSRQRGDWVRKYDGHINCYWYECDQCGEYRPRNQFGHEYNANFCPNCGARMLNGGEQDGNV